MSKHSTLKVSEHHLMSSLIKLFDCHLSRLIEGSELKGQSEHELNPLFEGKYFDSDYISHDVYLERSQNFKCKSFQLLGMFFFSCIWSIGAVCDSETKKKFNLIFTELLKGELSEDVQKSLQLGALDVPPLETPYVFPPPKECDVFSYKVKSFWLIKIW